MQEQEQKQDRDSQIDRAIGAKKYSLICWYYGKMASRGIFLYAFKRARLFRMFTMPRGKRTQTKHGIVSSGVCGPVRWKETTIAIRSV